MGVALERAAMMGELEVPDSVTKEGAMDQAYLLEAGQGTINGYLVELMVPQAVGNLALREGLGSGEQDSQDRDVAAGTT